MENLIGLIVIVISTDKNTLLLYIIACELIFTKLKIIYTGCFFNKLKVLLNMLEISRN